MNLITNKVNNNTSRHNLIVSSSRTNNNNSNGGGSQACAACKHQRRKCAPDCILAPYFPHDRQRQFQNAHKLFGVSNISKIIRPLSPFHKDEAMRTIIFESDVRAVDPVGGCYTIIRHLQHQIDQTQTELDLVHHHIAYFRSLHQVANTKNNNSHNINVNNKNNIFGPLKEEWCDQPPNMMPTSVVYPPTHQHNNHHQQEYLVFQNSEIDLIRNNDVAWGVYSREDMPISSAEVPIMPQLSNENDSGSCDIVKPILDLPCYVPVEEFTFGTDDTHDESDEAIVKDQEKEALDEQEDSLSNMLQIMI
ncbi:hypothetical protein DM860_013786 [Cuscuta australis]|uniref:LOB domain-containing protein n=1 Tax=Cuscuta australis TaxID=267555 RepID=A0A328DJF8_9ASTE|nr:hypothetical protein DM860_013786 [Cuscuta australis]